MSDTLSRPAFPVLSETAEAALAGYADLLREVMPMKAAHRRRLADNIQELSSFLIEDRAEFLGRDYLHTPAALGAYLWYFLPWNLLRLSRLLGGVGLDLPEGAQIVDLGAGPLTVVQALALARPDLLGKELHFHCLDTTPKPMREGRKLFHGLVNTLVGRQSRWKMHLVHAPWQVGIKDLPRADLLTAGNFLNELPWHRRDPLGEQMADLFQTVSGHVRPEGQCLFVEPGNRYGGKLVSLVRQSAVSKGWTVLGPCTHQQPCPMLEHRETSWCHFTLSTRGCPSWLAELSKEAELAKRDVSLSYVHLAGPRSPQRNPVQEGSAEQGRKTDPREEVARIISAEFSVPGQPREIRGDSEYATRIGRYGCTAQGKLLVLSASGRSVTRSGDLVRILPCDPPWRDPKTRAVVADLQTDAAGPTTSQPSPPGTRHNTPTRPSAHADRQNLKPGGGPKPASQSRNTAKKRSNS